MHSFTRFIAPKPRERQALNNRIAWATHFHFQSPWPFRPKVNILAGGGTSRY